jgi:hypothetical protein
MKRIFLIRSGGFSEIFINKTNKLWKLKSGDLVARCKNVTGNNKDLFNGITNIAFFRQDTHVYFNLNPEKAIFMTNSNHLSVPSFSIQENIKFDFFNNDIGVINPSLGIFAIAYLRLHYPDYLIVLIDFTHQGNSRHNWESERHFAKQLEENNKLIYVIDKYKDVLGFELGKIGLFFAVLTLALKK